MTAHLTQIWRHPIKSHGRESVPSVRLTEGQTMPWDRVWAVAHEASKFDDATGEWVGCQNFVLCSKAPELQAVAIRTEEATGQLHLSHPAMADISVNPDRSEDAMRLVEWSRKLVPLNRAAPSRVARAVRGMTDTDYPSVSIISLASLRDLCDLSGQDLAVERFRGNLLVDGWAPWQEFQLLGKVIAIGDCRLLVRERIARCSATATSPVTGKLDFDVPGYIERRWGHRDFGIYAEIIAGGTIARDDPVKILP